MGKKRDHFKKIRDTKGTFHAKMGSIKDRNSMDLTEAEDIKKRWQEYTEELSSGHKKRSVFIPIPKKDNAKECSNYCTITVFSNTSKVMVKILLVRLQQCES